VPAQNNVEVIFLPPNVTSVVQPMDAGIIRTLKALYKRALVAFLYRESIWDVTDLPVPTPAQGIRWLVAAWDEIKSETIVHCWRHADIANEPAATAPAPPAGFVDASPPQLQESLYSLEPTITEAHQEAVRVSIAKDRGIMPRMPTLVIIVM